MADTKRGKNISATVKVFFFLLFTSIAVSALGQVEESKTPVEKKAEAVAELFRENPVSAINGSYENLFAPSFLNFVSDAQLTGIFTRYFSNYGRVIRVEAREIKSPTVGTFYLIFEKGYRAPIKGIRVESKAPHLIKGLVIGLAEPVKQPETFEELTEKFESLDGEASLFVAAIGEKGELKPLAAYQSKEALAIGSAFKLYVLGALVQAIEEGRRSWTDIIELDEEDKSLPSGILQTWPSGSPLTLHTAATLMISMSDNTATDLLIEALGRKKVEQALKFMNHHKPSLNKPFLKTKELFALKTDSSLAKLYLNSNEGERRGLLEEKVELTDRESFSIWTQPKYIKSIEWFASARDLAGAIMWFKGDSKVKQFAREILSVNPGLDFNKNRWAYVGYKGGSEPGVVSMTYLLKSDDGNWYVLSAAWNNTKKAVDMPHFYSLVKQAVNLIE